MPAAGTTAGPAAPPPGRSRAGGGRPPSPWSPPREKPPRAPPPGGGRLKPADALLGRYHVERELGDDLRVQAYLDLVVADRLDVPGQLDPAPVQVRTAGRPDRRDDLAGGDRAEQPATGTRTCGQADLQVLQLRLRLVGVAQIPDLPGRPGPLDHRDLLLRAPGPRDGETLRKQVVAPVPVLDLDDVTGGAEAGYLLGQDDLHVGAPSQRAVAVYGRSAISRAFLTARAIWRCCWALTPVTRRARIFPRSEMNLRSSAVSL